MAAKKLVIVESPTKARTIQQFLGKGYDIVASFGHVRDLPRSTLGIDIENSFTPKYVIPRASQKRVNGLKKQIIKAEEIILATDEDREGEAIAWHITQLVAPPGSEAPENLKRIVFHEITREAIENALASPRYIDMKRVNAQQARRILDRLVGYQLSPFLWKKVARGLSAGRVQSATLRLIVDREREREKFVPQEYWTIEAELETADEKRFAAHLVTRDGTDVEKFAIASAPDAALIEKDLAGASWTVAGVSVKDRTLNPLPPFRTSTLQQEAWRRLRFSARQTMVLAQQLYEGVEIDGESVGLITYMRTDSANLADGFLSSTQTFIAEQIGDTYAQGPRHFKGKAKGAQEAHEAIRPTSPSRTPESLKGKLEARQWKLYDLIWRRTIASQMPPALFATASADIDATGTASTYVFRANGSTLKFDGFLHVWPTKKEDAALPELSKGEQLTCMTLIPEQHFTEPPARYTEASIIKTLEEFGIGRPSTYAPIISTILARNYVERDEARRLKPTDIGILVNDLLVENFPEIVDLKFTAAMEEDLDKIANGDIEWVPVIQEFYDPFSKHLALKYETVEKHEAAMQPAGITCEKCGREMIIRFGRFGKFIACSGFPECKNTKPIIKSIGVTCPSCNEGEIIERKSKRGRFFFGCSKYPACTFALWEKPTGEKCPQCNSLIVQNKSGKRCSNKDCGWKAPKNDEAGVPQETPQDESQE